MLKEDRGQEAFRRQGVSSESVRRDTGCERRPHCNILVHSEYHHSLHLTIILVLVLLLVLLIREVRGHQPTCQCV